MYTQNLFLDPEIPSKPLVDSSTFLVTWSQPIIKPINYVIEINARNQTISKMTVTEPEFSVMELSEGFKYIVRVAAINSAGEGEYSDACEYFKSKKY